MMSKPIVHALAGDNRTLEVKIWSGWLKEAVKLAYRFSEVEDDPFAYNEAATVSLLTAAATKADLLALAEYISMKKNRLDRRYNNPGRCDLWVCAGNRSWAFEFKQKFYDGSYHKPETVLGWLADATLDASLVDRHEATKRFGVLVLSCAGVKILEPEFQDALEAVGNAVDYAWLLDPNTPHSGRTYLFFREV